MMIKVSVIIPIYNAADYLRQCIESVISQTLRQVEIICINDGSSDNSLEIIKEYAALDGRIVVVDKANSGYGHTMNVGIDLAKGEYIGIVESDDFAQPDMFEKLYSAGDNNSVEFVKSNFYNYYTKPQVKNQLYEYFSPLECGKVVRPIDHQNGNIFFRKPSVWSAIYRADFLRKNHIRFTQTKGASFQDTAFTFKVMATVQRAFFLYDGLIHYRQDNENSSVNSKEKVFCICDEYREIESFLDSSQQFSRLKTLACKAKYDGYMWNYERLGDEFKYAFLAGISEEFKRDLENNLVDPNIFEWWKIRGFNMIATSPMSYHIFRTVEIYEHGHPNIHYKQVEVATARKTVQLPAKISIIMPVYNVEKYLKACLECAVNQTLKEIEIICINDGSTDHSLCLLEQYAGKDERIVVINKRNGGVSSARNAGIAVANGEYILFLDSDDYIEPCACHKLYQLANANNQPDIIVFGANTFPQDALVNDAVKADWFRHTLSPKECVCEDFSAQLFLQSPYTRPFIWMNCFRAEFIKGNNFAFNKKIKFGEDIVFQFSVFPKAKKVVFIKDKLYNYRVARSGSLTEKASNHITGIVTAHLYVVAKIFSQWGRGGYTKKLPVQLLAWSIEYVCVLIQQLPQHCKPHFASRMVRIWNKFSLLEYQTQLESWQQKIVTDMQILAKDNIKAKLNRTKENLRTLLKRFLPAPAKSFHSRMDNLEQSIGSVRQELARNSEIANAIQNKLYQQSKTERHKHIRKKPVHRMRKK